MSDPSIAGNHITRLHPRPRAPPISWQLPPQVAALGAGQ